MRESATRPAWFRATLGALSFLCISVVLGVAPKPAGAAVAALSCPATVDAGGQFVAEVVINVDTTPLGAYGITLGYVPAVVTIASVAGGNTPEFSPQPTANPGTFTSGSSPISGFQSTRLDGPTGAVSVTRVTFDVSASASTPAVIDLTVRSMFDTGGNTISSTATGCTVSVMGSGTTTTSTTINNSTTTRTVTSTTSPQLPPTTVVEVVPTTTTTLVTTLPPSKCPDAQAAATIQAAIDVKCNCLTATRHGAYVNCAAKEAKRVVKENGFPKACQAAAKVCAAQSTCGKAGFVTCCRTNAKGATKCSIKNGPAACKAPKNGHACVGQHPSCCDACGGGCS
jgi:hypothetical protein